MRLAAIRVRFDRADLSFAFQQGDQNLFETYDFNRDNNPNFDPARVVIPFTHDWGHCFIFEWFVNAMLVFQVS